ncbi:hypothetical protein ACVGVM_10250 [Pseudonocardia bannensis]|uniref:Uncharacterized protein n=1 Tax=Pseudonocardia bannensis TaxID=630973 RepID=A0A848DHT2_9PSEU|nr:hypothetical protein [Pseudonocardia bannensis]NMH92044.1 hypothetical protein [Pseudonocardia bannensis]
MDERETVGRRYSEHLTDHDLLTLAGGRADQVAVLRREPTLVLDLLDRPGVADAVMAARCAEAGRFSYLSPFLVFAAAVHRVSNALVGSSYVTDRAGPRFRVPVFDGPVLAAFATQPAHRLFLAELLASYARIASGVVWRRDEHGWRRQRWDELDLPRLAALLGAVPTREQPGIWRRIGDGALFLAGVFPEYARRSLGLVEVARLQRATGLRLATAEGDVCDLLEELAAAAYERVGAGMPRTVAEAPRSARRMLTLVADRYLFPVAADWLPAPGT